MPVDLTQFKRGLIYRDQASSTQLSASIDQIREFDRSIERTRRNLTRTMIISFLVGLAAVVSIAVLDLKILIPVPLLCGIVFIGAIIYGLRIRKLDLQNRRYELLHDLADMLSRDMPKDAPFDLTLDLAPHNETRKKSGQEKVADWNVTYFEDPWLSLEGRFVDGTAFEIAMVDRHQARKKWAKSSSGKSKLKTKTKSATVASVSLFPKQKKYSNLDQVVHRTEQLLRLPDWVRVKKVSADADKLMIAAVTSEVWSVRRNDPKTKFDGTEVVVTMLLSLYQVLHASKAAAKS